MGDMLQEEQKAEKLDRLLGYLEKPSALQMAKMLVQV